MLTALATLVLSPPTPVQKTPLAFQLGNLKGCVVSGIEDAHLDSQQGAVTGIKVGGTWFTSAKPNHSPMVAATRYGLTMSSIEYGPPSMPVAETWTFTQKNRSILWKIDRRYGASGTVEDTAMPKFSFPTLSTWTGALLGTGGVAWCKLFDQPNATYGIHTGSATFWNAQYAKALSVSEVDSSKGQTAMRFTREPGGQFSLSGSVTTGERAENHDKAHFLKDRQDVWKPFSVTAGQTVSATYEIKISDFRESFGRGDFKGLNTSAITELVNTIGRIGVIDNYLIGTNGWYSGYICLHEPWIAMIGGTVNDPNYLKTNARWLDYVRENAVKSDGMVMSRWWYYSGDAQPGTYNPKTGFYEAQWGRLMDSQTCYPTNVADQFDLTGDMAWLKRQKSSCEAALEYLLRRDSNHNHLVEMQNSLTSQRRSSDWLDIVWASHENALVNGQMYGALRKWTRLEKLLGDPAKAQYYTRYADALKISFNKPISEGGFWNPAKGWYVYWRDADNSIHGDNLVIPVNLTAIGEGICDDPARKTRLLDTIERRMHAESLLAWPACFDGYAKGEGADDHFPTYENGDIFLSWCEYGVRAYAHSHPELALKYVRKIVDQYSKDGLAFQRYLRTNSQGAGDDILGGNCNVISGLYRDIYGIQPKYNRLYLEPHLMPELNGTKVAYRYRGQKLNIGLSLNDYSIRSGAITARSKEPFGFDGTNGNATLFAGNSDTPALMLHSPTGAISILNFNWKERSWSIKSGPKPMRILHTFLDLPEGHSFAVMAGSRTLAVVSSKRRDVAILVPSNSVLALKLVTR